MEKKSILTPMDLMCDQCKQIDFEKAFSILPHDISKLTDNRGIYIASLATRCEPHIQEECRLCQLFCSVALGLDSKQASEQIKYELRAFSFLDNYVGAFGSRLPASYIQQAGVRLAVLPQQIPSSPDSPRLQDFHESVAYLSCFKDTSPGSLFRPQLIPQHFDAKKAREWIDICTKNHSYSCSETVHVPGMKVIDCKTRNIVLIPNSTPWITLSYVWGPFLDTRSAPITRKSKSGQVILPSILPSTIEDAMAVTLALGYQYIWIDKYCIDQENLGEKKDWIARMDLIYRGSDITLVAAAGEDEHYGLPGIGHTKKSVQDVLELGNITLLSTMLPPCYCIEVSKWNSRGWTLQEKILSRRRLFFVEHQMYFECSEMNCCEAVGGPEYIKDEGEMVEFSKGINHAFGGILKSAAEGFWNQVQMLPKTLQDREANFEAIISLTEMYSGRDLTYDSDGLNAFAGLMRAFGGAGNPIFNLHGIPCLPPTDNTPPEILEKYLVTGLSWFHGNEEIVQRRERFPSWTWAGWDGDFVFWMFIPDDSYHFFKAHACDFSIEGDCGYISSLQQSLDFLTTPNPQSPLRNPKAIHFRALAIPTHLVSFDGDGKSWQNFSIDGNHLAARNRTISHSVESFLSKVHTGQWELFFLGEYQRAGCYTRIRVLVVDWQDTLTSTAKRVTIFLCHRNPDNWFEIDEDKPSFLTNLDLEWKRIRLV